MIAVSIGQGLAVFAVGFLAFAIFFIRDAMVDPDVICITCKEPCYQDSDGVWRHDNWKLNLKHPAIPYVKGND